MADEQNGNSGTVDVPALIAANAQLSSDLATVTLERDGAVTQRDAVAQELSDAKAALSTAENDKTALAADLAAITLERDQLRKAKDDADAAAAATPAVVEKLRAIGPVKDQPGAADLLAAISEAGSVQLAFSDGKKEIDGLSPLDITGNAWAMAPVGLALRVPSLVIISGAPGVVELAGYGLFLDGKLVAYTGRMDVLRIAPSRKFDITNDVVFP